MKLNVDDVIHKLQNNNKGKFSPPEWGDNKEFVKPFNDLLCAYINHKKWICSIPEYNGKKTNNDYADFICHKYLFLFYDIEKNGIKEPIEIKNENGLLVCDGWHRLLIAKFLNMKEIECTYKEGVI